MDTTPIDLADTPPFRLGAVLVEPAALRLVGPTGADVHLQPRVMQVLVALGRGGGGTLSRDELNLRCWNGRVVGADAIDRAIAHLRRASADLGATFQIETIPRVGFRLLASDALPDPAVDSREAAPSAPGDAPHPAAPERGQSALVGRRAAIAIAGAVAAVMGAGALRWWPTRTPPPSAIPEARRLVALGSEALRQELREQARQAASYFERATDLQPGLAEAWGGLALAHLQLVNEGTEEIETARTRSAAARALAIDPDEPAATAALILSRPTFRNWIPMERAIRQGIKRQPGNPALLSALGNLYAEVGSWRDAVALFRRCLALEPFQPSDRLDLAASLWGSGDLAGADAAFLDAARLWPGHRDLWLWHLHFLALTERAREAQAMALDEETRPPQGPGDLPLPYDVYAVCAEALLPGGGSSLDKAVEKITAARAQGVIGTMEAVLYVAALGRPDAVFTLLYPYYFGGGPKRLPAPGPLTRRYTGFLFLPPLVRVRRDLRFSALTKRIGLTDYWRRTGAWPDGRAGIALVRP